MPPFVQNNKSVIFIDEVFSKRMDSNTQLGVGFKRIWLMFEEQQQIQPIRIQDKGPVITITMRRCD
ncbi:hypothetical protein P5673_000862 [Acropora cervicornis]|uniref:Uncharacterized protein n=1 Tax=Acropora cervicornis TaxID=6130 RepID=A0AAD9R7T5_ACRCE|nr:hypothetical protein P5673_000862 [Acropora cervicornis]